MQNLRFSIAAGETKQFQITGRYLEVIDSTAAIDIDLTGPDGGISDRATGILSGTYMGTPFNGFAVQSDTAQTVELFLADTPGGTKRQPGNVRVIDQSADKTRAGRQFMSTPGRVANVAAHSLVSIAPNGAIAVVKKVMVSSATAGQILMVRGSGIGTAQTVPSSLPNKLIGGAGSTARVYEGNAAGIPTTAGEMPGFAYFASTYVGANTPVEFPLTTPIVLDGTAGNPVLAFMTAAVNRDITVTFDLEEV